MNQVINDRYELLNPLGQGASSRVFEVHDRQDGVNRALKLVWEGADEDLVRAEFRRLSRLDHPGLVKVHDLDRVRPDPSADPDGEPRLDGLFLVADLVAGQDPRSALQALAPARRDAWLRGVAMDLARALHHMHRLGLVHRDIKPDNFIISRHAGAPSAVLFDLGLSSRVEEGVLAGRGTLAFMAPEALVGGGDHRVDLYSLGATLYQVACGRPPMAGRGPTLIQQILTAEPELECQWLSAEMTRLILKLLAKAPLARPQSARRVLMELHRMAGDHEQVARLSGQGELLTPAFTNREQERALLNRRLEGLADQRRPRVVWVVGPPGAGKSRLVDEALRRHRILAAAGTRPAGPILAGAAPEILGELLDSAGLRGAADPALALADALEERYRGGDPHVLHLRVDPDDSVAHDLLAVLERTGEGERAPLLVLAEADMPPPEREELTPDLVELRPLNLTETAELVGSMLGQAPGVALSQRIQVLSGGVPALAVELVRLWHRGGDPALEGEMPSGLDPLLRRGRERLEEEPRAVMDALAVWGEPCEPRVLERLTGLSAAQVQAALEALPGLGASVVLDGEDAHLPGRAHVEGWRRAAGDQARHLFERGARLLEGAGAPVHRADLLLAGQLPGAGEAALEAARALSVTNRAAAAVVLLERAAQLPAGAPAQAEAMLRTLYLGVGRYEEALALLPPAPELALMRARALQLMGRYEEAEATLEGHLPAIGPHQHQERREALALWGRLKLRQGQPAEALGLVAAEAEQVTAADQAAVTAGDAGLLEVAGLAHLYMGRPDRADALFAAGAASLRADEAPDLLARFHDLRGMVAFTAGDLALAGEHYQAAVDLAAGAGDRHTEASLLANLGSVQLERGRPAAALGMLSRATRDLRRLAHTTELASCLCNLANLLLLLGDLDHAAREVERAREVAGRLGSERVRGYTLSLEADLLRRRGRPGEAEARYEQAAALFQQLDASREAQLSVMARAEALGEAGHPGQGGTLLDALDAADEAGPLAVARARLALSPDGPAAPPQTAEVLARHCATLEDQGHHKDLWRAAAVLARYLAATADPAAARAAARHACHTWEEIMKETPEVYHASMQDDPDARELAEIWPSLMQGQGADPAPGREPDQGAAEGDPPAPPRASVRRLLAINKRLNAEHRLPQLLDYIIDTVIDLTEAERGFLLLAEPDGSLQVKVARNIDQRALQVPAGGGEVPLSLSIAEQAARTAEPVITVDATEDGRFAEALSVSHLRLRSVLAVPLMVKGRPVGTIYVDHRLRQGVFAEREAQLVLDLADQAAIAIENARLLAENSRRQQEIERLNLQLQEQVEHQEAELDGVREELRSSKQALALQYDYRNIIGKTPRMMELFRLMDRVTETDLPVVIQGESGTGKELVARAIHVNGKRSNGPFVGENCGAIPETLLESVLFGHVKGAFTGADRERRGLFEVASGGTLFLDEVGETSPAMQTKLLRVLQDGEVRRVGGDRTRRTDVRIVAASNKDLSRLVEQGKFREDLFYRLNVVRVEIPPLRERREDIPLLVEHFLGKHSPELSRTITREALAALMGYAWPGNVRELENEVMRLCALAGEVVDPDELSLQVRGGIPLNLGDADDLSIKARVEHLEKELITRALKKTGGNNTRAAKMLGLSRYGLLKKLKRYGFVKEQTKK